MSYNWVSHFSPSPLYDVEGIHCSTVLLLKMCLEIGEQVSREETVNSMGTLGKRSSWCFRQ